MAQKVRGFKIDPKKIRIYGVVGSLVGLYLAALLNGASGTNMFSFISALGAIFAVLWGANAVRRVCSYGIGTGVPSIGMLALGMGTVAVLFGLNFAEQIGLGLLAPIITLVYSLIFGYIIGTIANKVIKFNIPVMEECMTDLAGAGSLAMLAWCVAISGSISYNAVVADVFKTGFLAIIFICGGLAILHPFNANLGPDEKQDRTLVNGIMVAGLSMIATGVCAIYTQGLEAGMLQIVVAFAVWYYAYVWYYRLAVRDASAVVGTGLLPPSAL